MAPENNDMIGVSVIVCCYNSSTRLRDTLKYLSRQLVPDHIPWEIVIVDNASTDNTKAFAIAEWKNFADKVVNFKIVDQPLQGLSYARSMGVKESQYDVLIFCDDDNWLNEEYVRAAYEILLSDPAIGAAGGIGMAVSNIELPNWFEDYKHAYACFEQGQTEGALVGLNSHLYGAGMVVRRSALKLLYERNFSNILADRSALNLSSGGDTELSYAIRIVGYKLWYSPRLKFFHFIPSVRLSLNYLSDLLVSLAFSSMYLVIYQYALSGKKVGIMDWFKDMLLRVCLAIVEVIRPSKHKITLGFFIAARIAITPVLAVASLCGRYRKLYKNISALRR